MLQTPQSWSAIFAGTIQVTPGGTSDPPVLGGNLPPSQAHDNRGTLCERAVRSTIGRVARSTQLPIASFRVRTLAASAIQTCEALSKTRSAAVLSRSTSEPSAISNHSRPVPSSWPLRLRTAALRVQGFENDSCFDNCVRGALPPKSRRRPSLAHVRNLRVALRLRG